MPFDKKYLFKKNNIVVIKHGGGKHLRVNPQAEHQADAHGGKGKFAQWHIELHDFGKKCKLKNKHSGKYLRIQGGDTVNVGGVGGPLTLFKVHTWGQVNEVKLESNKFVGKYVAVRNGNVVIGGGGPFTKLEIFRD